jgi:hypothetical protein
MNINLNQIPEVVIGFNEEWEINNWYDTVKKEPNYGLKSGKTRWGLGDIPEDVSAIILDSDSEHTAKSELKIRLENELKKPEKRKLVDETINKAKERWQSVSEDFFPLLSDLLNIPLEKFEKKYFAYFTFSTRCPFFGNTFMFNKYINFSDIAMHEIMHIEFLKEYENYCKEKGLNYEQVGHLKEILTVLLNEPMKNLLIRVDPGYTKHQELRSKAVEIYKTSENFRVFLDKIIDLIKAASF